MSILIKGMEMPKEDVALIISPDGSVTTLYDNTYEAIPVPPHVHFAREYRQNEDLAEALRMAARAAADSERLTDLRVTLSEFGYRAAQLLDHGTQDHMTALLKDFAAAARIRGLIN